MTWDQTGYILSSDYRTQTVVALEEGEKQPSEIAEETGIELSHVSRTLNQLSDRDVVQVLNPDAKKGRLYTLTDDGQATLKDIDPQDTSTDSAIPDTDTHDPRSGVFIEIDEDDAIVGLQLKALDEMGNEFIAGGIIPGPGRYELRKVSEDE